MREEFVDKIYSHNWGNNVWAYPWKPLMTIKLSEFLSKLLLTQNSKESCVCMSLIKNI